MVSLKSKIYVAGHNGLVGSAIVRQLKKKGYKKIIIANRSTLDLMTTTSTQSTRTAQRNGHLIREMM